METQHVRVQANVVDVKTGREETTNDFRFTFARDDGYHEVPRIIPRTYHGMIAPAQIWNYHVTLLVFDIRRGDALVRGQEGT